MASDFKPVIGVTMGDAAGIGPEIVVKALSRRETYDICKPLVIGDLGAMTMGREVAASKIELKSVSSVSECLFTFGTIDVLDLKNLDLRELRMGEPQAMAGKAAFEYIKTAVDLALSGEIHAIVTAPISKEALNIAGYNFAGHTEILAHLTDTKEYAMMLVSGDLRIIHVSTHVSLREACEMVTKVRVYKTIKLAHKTLTDLGITDPKIAVAGLNPHSGEGGLFGREEIEEIEPAIREAKASGIKASGPYSPDTVFLRAEKGGFDAVVAMYHDQGHIPLKLLGFMSGVNVTLGLPIIRTSVDHGTAYRRAGLKLGTADPTSLMEALKLAVRLTEIKFSPRELKKGTKQPLPSEP